MLDEYGRVQQHADRDEEQHGEGVAQRDGLLGGALAEVAFAQHHAGEEGAEGEGDTEQMGGAIGHPEGDGVDGEAEQFARAGMRGEVHQPRNDAPADDQHDRHEDRDLGQRDEKGEQDAGGGHAVARRCDRERRQQDQREHHREILDHQPADGDAAAMGLEDMPLLQGADQDDGAGNGEREAEHEAGDGRPAERPGEAGAHQGRDGDLPDGARDGDARDREQILQGEVQAHAEHQQDDADLGEFGSEGRIGVEARRVGTDQDAGQQVADQRLYPQPLGDQAEHEGEHQTRSDRRNERGLMLRHPVSLSD